MSTKGTKIYGNAKVTRMGSCCMGNMALETPYVAFEMLSGPRIGHLYRWQSPRIEEIGLREDQEIYITAFAYPREGRIDALKRVQFPLENNVDALNAELAQFEAADNERKQQGEEKMNEREYDRIQNEGCEGYNPIRAQRQDREAMERTPRTRDSVLRELERVDSSIARESGTYNQVRVDALNAELAQFEAAEQAQKIQHMIAAGFVDAEITATRRAEWKNWVLANATKKGINLVLVAKKEQAQGWTVDDLKLAVKYYGLAEKQN